jgi:mono/diheme cytochrome c family protein
MNPAAKAHPAGLLRSLSRQKTARNSDRRPNRTGAGIGRLFEAPAENTLRESAHNPTGIRCSAAFTALFLALFPLTSQLPAANPLRRTAVEESELPVALTRPVKYFGDVHPILTEHCVSCHGPEKQKGGLRLDSLAAALAGGSGYGAALAPGKSSESPLLLFAAHLEPEMEMPPKKPMLSQDQLATLRTWIDQGAAWPSLPDKGTAGGARLGDQEFFFKKARTHWAFQPVPKADPVSLENGSVKIDSLIAAGLSRKNLKPSPRADARTLLRRLHFDVTGLPPTPTELEDFEAKFQKNAATALSEKVDELLASPHYGERWGRYWLDLARYADSQDFFPAQDLRYPFAWTYRDYVTSAFNADKPYDHFLREQIAADQLGLKPNDPRLAALGFLTVGPRFLRRPDEIINDRIDAVTRGLMGLTVVCARCHDHKYDPIPTTDFYALHGIFSSTEDLVTLPEIEQADGGNDPALRAEYEKLKTKAGSDLKALTEGLRKGATEDIKSKPEAYFDALCQLDFQKKEIKKVLSDTKLLESALQPLQQQWNTLKKSNTALDDPVLAPLARILTAPAGAKAAVLETIQTTGRVPAGKHDLHPAVLEEIRSTKPVGEEALLKMYGALLSKILRSPAPETEAVLGAFTASGGLFDLTLKDVESAARPSVASRKEYEKLDKALVELDATHPGSPARAMAVKDKAKPVSPVVYIRGESSRRGAPVDRRFLQVLDPKLTPFAADKSGRLELAERITDKSNPLTPRVWANHLWRHLLGRPLVKTTGDFGLQSDAPLQLELLNWLASALLERGWSTKRLVRDILLSNTYQQSSAERTDAAAVDVENTLFWRANRRRMDFEAMRDAILSASGHLDPQHGGRAVNLSTEPFSGRRTLYGFVDRTNIDPLFNTFDFPSPDIVNTERNQTLVPQQALFALNDSFIIHQARRLLTEAASSGNSGMDTFQWLYRRLYLRAPTPQESAIARAFLEETAEIHPEPPLGSWQYGFGSADPAVDRLAAFEPLPHFDPQVKRYQGSRTFPAPKLGFVSLSAGGGHPGTGLKMAAIRRWIAPQDGEFSLTGELAISPKGSGDGVRARVISSFSGLKAEWIIDRSGALTAATEVNTLVLKAGEILDFAVDSRENDNSDGFRWAPVLKLKASAEKTTGQMQAGWDAQAEFKAPPGAKLQPLEQLAQALLITNEFLFID